MPKRRGAVRHMIAALAAVVLPFALAGAVIWMVPAGCDERGDPEVYRWFCLFPVLLMSLPLVAAPALFAFQVINSRFGHKLPDGWLVLVIGSGCLSYAVWVGGSLLAMEPGHRKLFVADIVWIPHPILAGALVGGVYALALALLGRTR